MKMKVVWATARKIRDDRENDRCGPSTVLFQELQERSQAGNYHAEAAVKCIQDALDKIAHVQGARQKLKIMHRLQRSAF